MIPTALRIRVLAGAALLAAFLVGMGVGRGTTVPDAEVAIIGEAHGHILEKALGRPDGSTITREAIDGMLRALEDSYAEYLPPTSDRREDPGAVIERILGVERSTLLESSGLRGRVLEPGIGYVRLRLFSPGSASLVRAEVRRLVRADADGIVLDLRGNPGGLVEEALQVAGIFMGDSPVFLYETAAGGEGERVGIGPSIDGLRVVVCTDERTGSAAELLAGAMQDAGRGLVVGRRTAGKGTVQRVVTLSDGSAIKFTAAVFRTPAGREVDGTGIRPDITVDPGPGDRTLDRARSLLREPR